MKTTENWKFCSSFIPDIRCELSFYFVYLTINCYCFYEDLCKHFPLTLTAYETGKSWTIDKDSTIYSASNMIKYRFAGDNYAPWCHVADIGDTDIIDKTLYWILTDKFGTVLTSQWGMLEDD